MTEISTANTNEQEEGVEVVLDKRGSSKVVDAQVRPTPDQNVFREDHRARSGAARPPYPGPPPPVGPPPYVQGSGSFSYGHSAGDYPPRPYPVPPYNPSGSFDEAGSYPPRASSRGGGPPISHSHSHHSAHHSPYVQYPPPRYPTDDVNVISPNHKASNGTSSGRTSRGGPPPPSSSSASSGRGGQYYQYPPTSPVSRPGTTQSPPRLRNFAVRGRGGLPPSVEGPYSKAQRSSGSESHPEDGTWNPFPAPSHTGSAAAGDRPQPPLVTESSFDSDHYTRASHYSASHPPSHPPTPGSNSDPHAPPSMHHHHQYHHAGPYPPHHAGSQQQFYGTGSWASFDSAPPPPAAGHYDDPYSPHGPPSHASAHRSPYPDSPYSPYSHHSSYGASPHPHYSPAGSGYYPPHDGYHHHHHGYGYGPPRSYDDVDERGMLKDYHPDRDIEVFHGHNGSKKRNAKDKTASGIVLPAAASEVDFEVTDPPMEPVCPPSTEPLVESLGDVNTYDVLCGRGGGTNSQIGNKRFRKLVQEFQPTYLLARRKEKPLLARTIVLIIRKRGGRFLRKDDETGMLFEVGDAKAEAKTSQALREGLDVRATKSAANSLNKKKKKKSKTSKDVAEDSTPVSPASHDSCTTKDNKDEETTNQEVKKEENAAEDAMEKEKDEEAKATSIKLKKERSPERTPERQRPDDHKVDEPKSPPSLPKLSDEEMKAKAGMVHPHSPEAMQYRKRRRMPSMSCGADKFFPDFCPPRADLARAASPILDCEAVEAANAKTRENGDDKEDHDDDDDVVPRRKSSIDDDDEETAAETRPSCTNIAMEIMTGAANCFGPKSQKS